MFMICTIWNQLRIVRNQEPLCHRHEKASFSRATTPTDICVIEHRSYVIGRIGGQPIEQRMYFAQERRIIRSGKRDRRGAPAIQGSASKTNFIIQADHDAVQRRLPEWHG